MSSLVQEQASAPRTAPEEARQASLAWQLSLASRERVVAGLIFVLALALRLYQVGANGLRTDEMYSVWMAGQGIPRMLYAIVVEGRDATPPVYYTLLNLSMQLSTGLWAIRLVSVLAGALVVVVAFHLANHLFGFRVAALAALLVAIAPFSIEISQVARAYALTGLFVLASLYYFVRLAPPTMPRWVVWTYAAMTLLAIATHYLAGIILVFQNLVVFWLLVEGQLPRRRLLAWAKLQAGMALVSLPLLWMAVQRVPASPSGGGQSWLAEPSASGVVKTLILWGTGDPSYGGAAVTWPRVISLGLLLAILAVAALMAWRLRAPRADHRVELRNVAFVAAAVFVPWGLTVAVSSVRKIFNEKYFIYLSPLLLILLAWAVIRARPARLGQGLIVGLLAFTLLGLGVYFTAPNGEQWREAMSLVATERQPGDYVVTTPGYYIRPVSYYLDGSLVPDDYALTHSHFAVRGPRGYEHAESPGDADEAPLLNEVLAEADRVWLVTGYSQPDPGRLTWLHHNFQVQREQAYLGVKVVLLERRPESAPAGSSKTPLLDLGKDSWR